MINRRRAPSSEISSKKKIYGHKQEEIYANIIQGTVIKGTQKKDVKDKFGKMHSVKSGKKWQIFLYSYSRISNSLHLNILKGCLDSFPDNYDMYLKDRVSCISFKEDYIKKNGKDAGRILSNEEVQKKLGDNSYILAKYKLYENTQKISNLLEEKNIVKKFYNEAIFNNGEVDFLAIKDNSQPNNELFKVFERNDIINILSEFTFPSVSKAGRVPEDFNVDGQKVLFRYKNSNSNFKNIVEIEVRNDSESKYKSLRFNMYSKDTLYLLESNVDKKIINENLVVFGDAINKFSF